MKVVKSLFPYPIRLAVIDYPVRHWEDPAVQSMYNKVTALKLRGYWAKHGHDNVIPVDLSDLIGANIVTCYETPNGLVPVMAFRMLTLRRCDLHRNRFPALSVLESSRQDSSGLSEIVESARAGSRDIAYGSSWTRSEILPETPEARAFLRDMHTANMMNFMDSRGVAEFIACGVTRFKVDTYLAEIGMRAITENFAQHSVFDQIVKMFHISGTDRFSEESQAIRDHLSPYWENRVEIAEPGIDANSRSDSKAA